MEPYRSTPESNRNLGTHFTPQKTLEKMSNQKILEQVNKVTARNAQEVNTEAGKLYGIKGLVNEELQINTKYFAQEKGGPKTQDEIDTHERHVYQKHVQFSGADDPITQARYIKDFNIATPHEIVMKFRADKEGELSSIAEKVVTGVLHKILKDHFLVARTAPYDDYEHGIDNIIIDKETGAVICAFDEVLENESDRDRGPSKKIEKISKAAMSGGKKVEYGISIAGNKLTRTRITDLPVFYLPIEKRDISPLAADLFHSTNGVTEQEKIFFSSLITSIHNQMVLLKSLKLTPAIRAKLLEFEVSLKKLESIAQKFSVPVKH